MQSAQPVTARDQPDADRVEIHTVDTEQGVMRMRQLVEGPALPASWEVELAPGGYHLMLVGPRRRFAEGEQVTIELTFERAGAVRIAFPVRPLGATAAEQVHH